MYAADIVNEVVDAGLNENVFTVDLSEYLELLSEEDIESVLRSAGFIFKPLKGGKYKIFVEEAGEGKERLKKFVEEKIRTEGFDEYGNMRLDLSMVCDLSDFQVIKTIREMGLLCEKAEGDGNYWVCWIEGDRRWTNEKEKIRYRT